MKQKVNHSHKKCGNELDHQKKKSALPIQPKLGVEFRFNAAPEEDTNLHGHTLSKTNIHNKAF